MECEPHNHCDCSTGPGGTGVIFTKTDDFQMANIVNPNIIASSGVMQARGGRDAWGLGWQGF